MLQIKIILVIFSQLLLIMINGKIDYCDKNLLCKNARGPHIKCNNNAKFSRNCPDNSQLIKLTDNDRQKIVNAHNKNRNNLAGGNIPGYEPAVRMAQMKWSKQLEGMAQLNVKTCKFEHDNCRNTPKYLYSGQNLFTQSQFPPPEIPKNLFFDAIDNWFSEYEDADMSIINSFHGNGKQIGHFTVMASERNNAVGCAAVTFKDNKITTTNIACNYTFTNIVNKPIYKNGTSGSDCIQGVDLKFTSLCNITENYNLNKI